MVYVLILCSTYYDFDTHYDEEILGVYSTEDMAEIAMRNFDKSFDNDMRPYCDKWDTKVVEYELNPKELPYIGGEDE